jgi:hypothetical protein
VVRFWIQNVRDIDLKRISVTEDSNKFLKTRFWKEKSVEDVVTLGPTAQATLVHIITPVCTRICIQTRFKKISAQKSNP